MKAHPVADEMGSPELVTRCASSLSSVFDGKPRTVNTQELHFLRSHMVLKWCLIDPETSFLNLIVFIILS